MKTLLMCAAVLVASGLVGACETIPDAGVSEAGQCMTFRMTGSTFASGIMAPMVEPCRS